MDPEACAVIMTGKMRSWAWSIRLGKHFVLQLSRHTCSWSRHSSWVLSNRWTGIILIAALLPHWMRGCSNRLPWLLLATSCDVGLFDRSIRTCWPGSLPLSCMLRAFRGWVSVARRVTGTDSYLLTLFSLHGCCRCLKLVWSGIWLLDSWAVQHWRLKLLLLRLLLLYMALSISGQTRILPWVHHFRSWE